MRGSLHTAGLALLVGAAIAGPGPAGPGPAGPGPAVSLDALSWLEGTWERDSRHGTVYETWRRLSARTMEGESYSISASSGERRLHEALLLVAMGPDLFYVPRPLENPYPVAFRLTSAGDDVVFENPAHDFPTRIVYRRTGERSMTSIVEGPGSEEGEVRRLVFQFTRSD